MSVKPNPHHLQRQAYERFRHELVQSDHAYGLFWPTLGNPGLEEYTFMSIVGGASVWVGDTCRMLHDVLRCTPGVANRLGWALFVPEKAAKQRGGIASLYEDDVITLLTECTKWSRLNRIPFNFVHTRVRPRT